MLTDNGLLAARLLTDNRLLAALLLAVMCGMCMPLSAQNLFQRVENLLTNRYRKGGLDTAYVVRPQTKWTIRARVNVSGTDIETQGIDNGQHFKYVMEANRKTTLSLGVSYLGLSLSASLNPSKTAGKIPDYDLNLNCYGPRFGFDFIYQDAKNFTGHYEQDGMERIKLTDGMLQMQTLNLNAYYAFNHRRFSYPAAFSQSYIQRRSAGSFLLAASAMGQRATLNGEQQSKMEMTNIGIGAGYGYNFVPARGWLLHISALPTIILYSKASLSVDEESMSLSYHFPEYIFTGRWAAVYQWSNKFLGMSMVWNYTHIGDKNDYAVMNLKWLFRAFVGLRI